MAGGSSSRFVIPPALLLVRIGSDDGALAGDPDEELLDEEQELGGGDLQARQHVEMRLLAAPQLATTPSREASSCLSAAPFV